MCSLFRGCFVLIFLSVPVSLRHEGKGYRLLSDSSTLSSFSFLFFFSSFPPFQPRVVLFSRYAPTDRPFRFFSTVEASSIIPLINAIHTGIPLFSFDHTLSKRITIRYGESSVVRHSRVVSFETCGQSRVFNDCYRRWRDRGIDMMYDCLHVRTFNCRRWSSVFAPV